MNLVKVNLLHLEFYNQAKNVPMDLPSSQIKIWDKSVKGGPELLSDIQI